MEIKSWEVMEFEICIPGLEKWKSHENWKKKCLGHGKLIEFQVFFSKLF